MHLTFAAFFHCYSSLCLNLTLFHLTDQVSMELCGLFPGSNQYWAGMVYGFVPVFLNLCLEAP